MHSALARLSADDLAPVLISRQVSLVPYPPRTALRAVWSVGPLPDSFWQWREANMREAVAIHEAGHALVMLAVGVPGIRAEVSDDGAAGEVAHSNPGLPQDIKLPDALDRLARIVAGAVWHAGIEAERLYGGFEAPAWSEYCWREYPDHIEAARILGDGFVRPPHGYVQQVCRAVLSRNWKSVETIASRLLAHGVWQPSDNPELDVRLGVEAAVISQAVDYLGRPDAY